jgi:hypothetical protein
MAKARAPKKRSNRGGSHGIFGHRPEALVWISGRVSAARFQAAQARLERAYELVHDRRPTRVTKPDVVEFLMMGEEEAIRRLSEQQRQDWLEKAAAANNGASRAGRG